MSLKNLIINVTGGDAQQLKSKLHENELYVKYYDGWESTGQLGVGIVSTRFYYYDIPHDELGGMVRFLQSNAGCLRVRGTFKIRITPQHAGNNRFD